MWQLLAAHMKRNIFWTGIKSLSADQYVWIIYFLAEDIPLLSPLEIARKEKILSQVIYQRQKMKLEL